MNLIPKLAELLGVEIGEEFKLKSDEAGEYDEIYRFDENAALQMKNRCGWEMSSRLAGVLAGDIEIIKLPFAPKYEEVYFCVSWGKNTIYIEDYHWEGDSIDYQRMYCGNCFRTRSEAAAHKFEIYEKLTGKKWGT